MKKGLRLTATPATPADEGPSQRAGCQLEPRCDGCDGRRVDDCYDVRLCTHTLWHSALRGHLF